MFRFPRSIFLFGISIRMQNTCKIISNCMRFMMYRKEKVNIKMNKNRTKMWFFVLLLITCWSVKSIHIFFFSMQTSESVLAYFLKIVIKKHSNNYFDCISLKANVSKTIHKTLLWFYSPKLPKCVNHIPDTIYNIYVTQL